MITISCRWVRFVGAVFFALAGGVALADPPPGWPGRYAVVGGKEVWTQPSGPITSPTEATFAAATGGGVTATSVIAPILADGRAVALTAYRAVTGTELFAAAARVISAGATPGVVVTATAAAYLASKVPAFLDWIAGDNGVNIRVDPATGQFQKRGMPPWSVWGNAVCSRPTLSEAVACAWPGMSVITFGAFNTLSGTIPIYLNGSLIANSTAQQSNDPNAPAGWLPASMDDLAPYMTPRSPPSTYAAQILYAGGALAATPVGMTGPSSLTEPPPLVATTQYPKQQDQTSTTLASGNPFNLPDNQSVDQVSTSSIMTGPGSRVINGSPILGLDLLAPQPITVPVTTTATRTYNPTTNQTTTVTVAVPHGATQTKTCTPTTSINTTASTSTVSKSVTCVTTTLDTTTGQTLTNTETTTDTAPLVPPTTQASDCAQFPGSVACSPMGSISDTALPGLPVLYTAKFADGVAGVWASNKAALFASPLFGLVSQLMPAGFSGGTCPVWQLPLAIGPWDYGSSDVAPPCWLWDVARAIIIISALLLARSLIFGG